MPIKFNEDDIKKAEDDVLNDEHHHDFRTVAARYFMAIAVGNNAYKASLETRARLRSALKASGMDNLITELKI